jgi:sorting nexin-25
VENVEAYLDRLYTAKRKAEKRITVLGGADDSVRKSAPSVAGN